MAEPHEPNETKEATNSNYVSTVVKTKFGMSGSILASKDAEGHNHYVTILDAEVGGPSQFVQLVDLLYHAVEGDTVTIRIYSFGGWVETGLNICQAIANTRARVTTVGMSIVASIAAVIWMAGHERKMLPGSALMVHMPSGGQFGKTLDIEEECRQLNEFFADFLHRIGKDIITDEEFDAIIQRREDTFISAEEVNKRLAKLGD